MAERNGGTILHHTTKYDGSLHYRFPAEVVHRSKETLILYRGPGISVDSYRGSMIAEHHVLLFYYGNRHHNVVVFWQEDWSPRMHYVNIITPPEWNGRVVTAVDMDLDLIRFATENRVIVDDEDEFEKHIKLYNYPQQLVDTCRGELDRIREAMSIEKGVLSNSIFDWRPGEPVAEEHLLPV